MPILRPQHSSSVERGRVNWNMAPPSGVPAVLHMDTFADALTMMLNMWNSLGVGPSPAYFAVGSVPRNHIERLREFTPSLVTDGRTCLGEFRGIRVFDHGMSSRRTNLWLMADGVPDFIFGEVINQPSEWDKRNETVLSILSETGPVPEEEEI